MPLVLFTHQIPPSSPHRQDTQSPVSSVSASPPLPSSKVLFLGIENCSTHHLSLSSHAERHLVTGSAIHSLLAVSEGLYLC